MWFTLLFLAVFFLAPRPITLLIGIACLKMGYDLVGILFLIWWFRVELPAQEEQGEQ